jgi:hypothetical protein
MSTHATVTVTVTPVGPISTDDLEFQVENAPLDTSTLAFLQVTLASDTTAINGHGQIVRTIEVDFTAGFVAMFPAGSDQRKPFWKYMLGSIEQYLPSVALAGEVVLS